MVTVLIIIALIEKMFEWLIKLHNNVNKMNNKNINSSTSIKYSY